MIKWIKDISDGLLIAFISLLCVALILTLPTYLIGWYRGYDEAERLYKPDIEKIQDLNKRYYEASNKLKDAMTEILKYKLELQNKKEYDNIPPIAFEPCHIEGCAVLHH